MEISKCPKCYHAFFVEKGCKRCVRKYFYTPVATIKAVQVKRATKPVKTKEIKKSKFELGTLKSPQYLGRKKLKFSEKGWIEQQRILIAERQTARNML